jgi:hypothetical protein
LGIAIFEFAIMATPILFEYITACGDTVSNTLFTKAHCMDGKFTTAAKAAITYQPSAEELEARAQMMQLQEQLRVDIARLHDRIEHQPRLDQP